MHVLAPLLVMLTAAEAPPQEVLERLQRSLAVLKPAEVVDAPTPPPLVEAEEEAQAEAEEAPPAEVLAPTPARPPAVELDELREESEGRSGGPPRAGVVAVAGVEGLINSTFALQPRVGLGVRVGLTAPTDTREDHFAAVPSVALVGGYAGLADHRLFAELRMELLVAQGGASLLMPGFTAYALGGFDALLAGGVDPYVGLGIGWDHNIFKNAKSGGHVGGGGNWGGLGGGWGGGGGGGLAALGVVVVAAVAVAVAVGLVIGFVCAGRLELRYHPLSVRNAPPTVAVLVGYGL